MNPRGARTAAFLACAAILVVFGSGVRPAKAETTGTLSEVAPALEEGLALGGPVTLIADKISYDEDTGVAFAEGNVEVGFGDRTIRADRIQFNTESGDVITSYSIHYTKLYDVSSRQDRGKQKSPRHRRGTGLLPDVDQGSVRL